MAGVADVLKDRRFRVGREGSDNEGHYHWGKIQSIEGLQHQFLNGVGEITSGAFSDCTHPFCPEH